MLLIISAKDAIPGTPLANYSVLEPEPLLYFLTFRPCKERHSAFVRSFILKLLFSFCSLHILAHFKRARVLIPIPNNSSRQARVLAE